MPTTLKLTIPAACSRGKGIAAVRTPSTQLCAFIRTNVLETYLKEPFFLWRLGQEDEVWEFVDVCAGQDQQGWEAKVEAYLWKDGDQVIFAKGGDMAIPGGMTPLQTPVVAGLALALRNEERDRTPAIIIRQDTTGTSGTPADAGTQPAEPLSLTEVEKKAMVKAVERVKTCLGQDWKEWAQLLDQESNCLLGGLNIQRPYPAGNLLKVIHVYLIWLQEVECLSGKLYRQTAAHQEVLLEKFLSGANLRYPKKALRPIRHLIAGEASKQDALLILGINSPLWADVTLADSKDYHQQMGQFISHKIRWYRVSSTPAN